MQDRLQFRALVLDHLRAVLKLAANFVRDVGQSGATICRLELLQPISVQTIDVIVDQFGSDLRRSRNLVKQ